MAILPTAPVVRGLSDEADLFSGSEPTATTPREAKSAPAGPRRNDRVPAAAPEAKATPPPRVGGAVNAGVTRAGVKCVPGVRQVPGSTYAAPCRSKFSGPNGGKTYRGVADKEIKVVVRDYADDPSSRAIQSIVFSAGAAPPEDVRKMRDVFIDYFNKTYELYGRKVVFEDFHSSAGFSAELRNEGREEACADATAIAEERKAFAVLPESLGFGPFSECAAEKKMVVPIGPYGFPESWYKRYHPYAWGIQMSCDRISHHVAEYVDKRLNGRNAKWARFAGYTQKKRVFGGIGPDIEAYAECIDLLRSRMKRSGVNPGPDFRYRVDPSTMPQQAAQAVALFQSRGVSTLVLGSDFVMNINLTSQARSQGWGPEWIIIGAGFQDFDNFTRLYDQDRIDGHLFGLSELGATADIWGPKSEPVRLYKKITGQNPPEGTDGFYFTLVHLYNMFQTAGPTLTPQAIAAGLVAQPPAGQPELAFGLWRYRPGLGIAHDHTAVDDSREVYWDGRATGYDGERGTFKETYGGKRFLNGQWPAEEPPIYPDR